MTDNKNEQPDVGEPLSIPRLAFSATAHCMTGCGIGEVLGLVIATAAGWGTSASIALAVALAFAFGYGLTILPLLRSGMAPATAMQTALATDSASIVVMEIVDNGIMLLIPGAMDAGLDSFRFWGSLAVAIGVAGLVAYPLNLWMIARGLVNPARHSHHRRS